jgi:cyclic beta-1,2-glucan synthetase
VRGDWQLLPWLLPKVPLAGGGKRPNDLSLIDRWKIVDNLRRSLAAPGLLALFVAGWVWLPGSPLVWTLAGLLLSATPFVTRVIDELAALLASDNKGYAAFRSIRNDALRWLLALAFLPYETALMLNAILITLWRLLVSHKHLLQWTTAADTVRFFGRTVNSDLTWRKMIFSIIFAAGMALFISQVNLAALPVALPLLLAWLLAPEIAYWISQPVSHEPVILAAGQRQELRSLARRTWFYFEKFVDPEGHWLPPDHFQESPRGTVAYRTSPTNIGLYLLSTLAAYDMGYIGLPGLALRLQDTFEGMDNLEQYRGHFLNWYNTRTLEPLPPRYASAVDSGNLAGCLLALRQGLLALPDSPILRRERWQGLLDTLAILTEW